MSDKSPDAFRTISEVADWLGVQPHVLRFWESKFSQVRPVKRAGGRRYYRPNDMLLLGGIRKLLHEDGLTIKGAQKILREEGMSHVARLSRPLDAESAALSDMAAEFDEDAQDRGFDRESAEPDTAPPPPEIKPVASSEPEPQVVPDPSPEPAPQPDAASEKPPLPSFMRRPAAHKPTEPELQEEKAQPRASDRLPSFLQPPKPTEGQPAPPRPPAAPPVEAREAELPLSFPAAPEDPAPEPAAVSRPKVVDAPDPDESAYEVASGALSASISTTSLSSQRRADVLPLVAQLAALRDRMAAGRDR